MLRKHLGLNSATDMEKDIDIIVKTTDRIGKIIQGLRSFSRNAETDPFHLIQSDELIQTALNLCSERFQRSGIGVHIEGKEHFSTEGREAQLVQVLVNLLNNSYDAIQNLNEKWIRIETSTNVIKVIDSGRGIPKGVAEKLMQPFYTTKEVGKGTGLGLSISRGIMNKHGGELSLDTLHPNTCFVLRFNVKNPN